MTCLCSRMSEVSTRILQAERWHDLRLLCSYICWLLMAVSWDLSWGFQLEHLRIAFLCVLGWLLGSKDKSFKRVRLGQKMYYVLWFSFIKPTGYLIYCVYFYYNFKTKDLLLTSTLPSTQLAESLPWFTYIDSILWKPVCFLYKLFRQLLWKRRLSFSKDVSKLKFHFIIALKQHFNYMLEAPRISD